MQRFPQLTLVIALLALASIGCGENPPTKPAVKPTVKTQAPPTYAKRTDGKYRESRFLRAHDMFLAADSPSIVSANEATFLEDDDEVLGLVVDGQPRAYSVPMLSYHHVVNDQIGETPIAVTY